jgi:hypothetical protein
MMRSFFTNNDAIQPQRRNKMAKSALQIKKSTLKRSWTKDDIRTLKSLARKEPLERIAKALKRTSGATRQKATQSGISLSMSSKKRKPSKAA